MHIAPHRSEQQAANPGVISLIWNVPAGNALLVYLTPPHQATSWKLLRRTQDEFAGPDDGGAVLVHWGRDNVVMDTRAVENDTPYFYRLYCYVGDQVIGAGSPTVSGTATATYHRVAPDAQEIVQDRLQKGLAVEVARGALKPESGSIEVFAAPLQLAEDAVFPMVTVHVDQNDPMERFIGNNLFGDVHFPNGLIGEQTGQLSQWSLSVIGASLNANERRDLRKAIRGVMLANMPIFEQLGLILPSFSQRDMEDPSYDAGPLFMTHGTFTCQAPDYVSDAVAPVREVVVDPTITVFREHRR